MKHFYLCSSPFTPAPNITPVLADGARGCGASGKTGLAQQPLRQVYNRLIFCLRPGGHAELGRRKPADLLEHQIKIVWIVVTDLESDFLGSQVGGAQQLNRLLDTLAGQIFDKCLSRLAAEDHTEMTA